MHRRCFIVVGAIKILIRNGPDFLAFANLNPNLIFDAQQLGQSLLAFGDVWILDQHRALPIIAIWNQRVIGIEFILNACCFKNLFDSEHLLNLVLDR